MLWSTTECLVIAPTLLSRSLSFSPQELSTAHGYSVSNVLTRSPGNSVLGTLAGCSHILLPQYMDHIDLTHIHHFRRWRRVEHLGSTPILLNNKNINQFEQCTLCSGSTEGPTYYWKSRCIYLEDFVSPPQRRPSGSIAITDGTGHSRYIDNAKQNCCGIASNLGEYTLGLPVSIGARTVTSGDSLRGASILAGMVARHSPPS